MIDYVKMSNYEINSRVHNAVACGGRYDLEVKGYQVTWTDRQTGRNTVTLRKEYDSKFKNYIGDPSSTWPIIVANKINIRFGADGHPCEAQFMQHGKESVESYHENPLRAAIIVFLMMQDAQS